MPSAWIHVVIDLIAYGRPYFDLHKKKDKACELLGTNHRIVDHDWYQAYRRLWNFHEPFPSGIKESIRILGNEEGADKAEEQMAWIDHDYIDRTWDVLSDSERKYGEGFFAWVLFNSKILKNWAGVDVFKGRIQRVIKGREIWESCPGLKPEYKRLCNYVKAVVKNDKILQNMLEDYGQEIKCIKGEPFAKLSVIPECLYRGYGFCLKNTRFPLRIAAGMTELGLLQEPQEIMIYETGILRGVDSGAGNLPRNAWVCERGEGD